MNEADYICNRIYIGLHNPGDWIRLASLIEQGIKPTCYEADISNLKVVAKKG